MTRTMPAIGLTKSVISHHLLTKRTTGNIRKCCDWSEHRGLVPGGYPSQAGECGQGSIPGGGDAWARFWRASIGSAWWLSGKEATCNVGPVGDAGSIPGTGRSPEAGHGNPLQYSCLKNPMERGAWWVSAYRDAKSWPRLKRLSSHWLSQLL